MALAVTGSRSHYGDSEKIIIGKSSQWVAFSEPFLTHSFLAPVRPTVPYNCCV